MAPCALCIRAIPFKLSYICKYILNNNEKFSKHIISPTTVSATTADDGARILYVRK